MSDTLLYCGVSLVVGFVSFCLLIAGWHSIDRRASHRQQPSEWHDQRRPREKP